MKKSIFLLGLLTTAICLSACGSKDYNMSFEEALEIANHSALQDILAENDTFEQAFTIAGNFDADGTKVDANISSTSKQSLADKNSESSVNFGANIATELGAVKTNGALDIKLIGDTIYLNLSSFDLTGSEDLAMLGMLAEGFKNQWFYISMTGLNDVPDTLSILRDSKELDEKTKDIIINDGSVVYNGKFTQFNGYNARKFSLDNEKLNALIKEFYSSISKSLDEEIEEGAPELNIKNFEGYLVITGKDKVTTVIENMDIAEDDVVMNANGFGGDDYSINMSVGDESIMTLDAKKNGSKYEISASIGNLMTLEGTISAKLSKGIDLNFDAKLTVKAEEEGTNDTIIPFKGSWKYNPISSFTATIPENAQDLNELLGSYLGGMMGGDIYDYDEDYDYEDLDYEDIDGLEDYETANAEEIAETVEESVEAAE